ncbi:MAG: elongation factor P [Actinobacteria bacterium]|nr:MAG: elongation factor P [Actinomycetota bacterium]
MVSTNDLKNGMVLNLDGQLWSVLWFQHHKPGKGGAVVRTKLRNVASGAVVEKTFRADEKVDQAVVDKREMSYLYHDGTHFVFMDSQTYDQLSVEEDEIGDNKHWITEGQVATLSLYEGRPVAVELPASVELKIEHTDPGVKGDRVSGAMKPATLSTGVTVQVPLFIESGETVRVDTRTGEYITRVS